MKPVVADHRRLIDRVVAYFRIVGWLLFAFGLFAFWHYVMAYLDPTAKVVLNHTLTSDPVTKRLAVIFCALFSSVGAAFALTPGATLRSILAWHFKMAEKYLRIASGMRNE
jgi:hypothetical protein